MTTRFSENTETQKDPVVEGSLSWHLAIAALLLVVATGWAAYDEFYGRQGWKDYLPRFVPLYRAHVEELKGYQREQEQAVREMEGYQELEQALKADEDEVRTEFGEVNDHLNKVVNPQLAAVTGTMQEARALINALTYDLEVSVSEKGRGELRARIRLEKDRERRLSLPDGTGRTQEVAYTYDKLVGEFNRLRDEKGALRAKLGALRQPASKLRSKRNAFMDRQLDGLTVEKLDGLLRALDGASPDITSHQIVDDSAGLVDRCEVCHLAIRSPVPVTKEDMGGEGAFSSHPRQNELLGVHDPEKFGCSPCHGGNGRALTNVQEAHGRYKHWLWPLHHRENFEAGCLQCHEKALYLEGAEVLSRGKELFRHNGCWGCHPRDGFDLESEGLKEIARALLSIQTRRLRYEKELDLTIWLADDPDTLDEELPALRAQEEKLTLMLSGLDAEEQQLSLQRRSLNRARKDVAPNLKEVRAKLEREWVPVWIRDPKAFRPSTRMPKFRLPEDHVTAIAAFVWQAGVEPRFGKQPPGDASNGENLFQKRGCLGCHRVNGQGGTFAADLTRIGEKASYDYLAHWVHDPRERTLPYCQVCQKDITANDYAQTGRTFHFSVDDSLCPICKSEMQVQNQTVMPSLRLTRQEARDIASYLMTLKTDATYEQAAYLDDPALFQEGKRLAAHYGCLGCHEIAGMETLGKVGTELTKEGSKPIERLDFALKTHSAKVEGWYNHKGYFEKKLATPAFFDEGKEKSDPLEKLKMPEFGLGIEDLDAVTTFLLGSVDSQLPSPFYHTPTGLQKDIMEGWWVVQKYNCIGCHEIVPGMKPEILGLPQYEGEKKELAPPSLVGQGARTDPGWLADFLRNPALSESNSHQNGVRAYLDIRMPMFTFSEGEIGKLVRFFNALANQPTPYPKVPLERLEGTELELAREAFHVSDCMKCHASGGPSTFTEQTIAPSFQLTPERLKPMWLERWMIDPARLMPGTKMPTGLFRRQDDRWVILGSIPDSIRDYPGDHVQLMVRYLMQFDDTEVQQLERME